MEIITNLDFDDVLKPVSAVMRHRYCNCGGEFEYRSNDIVLASYPPKYAHVCDRCGSVVLFTDMFPKIEYEEIDD